MKMHADIVPIKKSKLLKQNEIVENITGALANYIASKEKAPASNGGKSPDTKSAQSDAASLPRKNVSTVPVNKR